MPVSLRSAADVANTLARQPDAALMDIWGLDAMAVQYMLMDSINRVLVQCKASRRQRLAQQWLCLCWKAQLLASCTPVLLYAGSEFGCQQLWGGITLLADVLSQVLAACFQQPTMLWHCSKCRLSISV